MSGEVYMTYIDTKTVAVVDTFDEFIEAFAIDAVEFVSTLPDSVDENLTELVNDRAIDDSGKEKVESVTELPERTIVSILRSEYKANCYGLYDDYIDQLEGYYTNTTTSGGFYQILRIPDEVVEATGETQ